jgi:SAM-dependent methyltransferase
MPSLGRSLRNGLWVRLALRLIRVDSSNVRNVESNGTNLLYRREFQDMARLMRRKPAPDPDDGQPTDASQARPARPSAPALPDPRVVGLQDASLSGFYDRATGELFGGVTVGADDIVVDVGCGESATLKFCADLGARVVGVDSDENTLTRARSTLEGTDFDPNDFHLASGEDIPLSDGFATRVVCQEVLEHVTDPTQVVRELYRIGQPGSLYLITVPDALQEHLQQKVAPKEYFAPPNHIRILERDEFRTLVQESGLEVLDHTFTGFYWSIWFALFWSRGVDFTGEGDPVLTHWAAAWKALLDSDNGADVKAKLDEFLPKRQIIVAKKPG